MSSSSSSSPLHDVFPFLRPSRTEPDPFLHYEDPEPDRPPVIVIDNGSYQCRLGWHTSQSPSLIYKNILAKTRREKGKTESELLVANDLTNIEAMRYNLKTPFDRNCVTQIEHQETLLDYGLAHLGLKEEGQAERHPVVMTEATANPNACREQMNELLFEGYGFPSVCYGLDSILSLRHNQPGLFGLDTSTTQPTTPPKTALVISCGFHTTHFVPLINGQICTKGLRRLNVGGIHLTNYLQRALQLKYPSHVNNITVSRAEEMLQDHCHIVRDYASELRRWSERDFYARHVHKMQLPFTPAPKAPPVDPEVLRQRRQELAKRLVEMNVRKREEKLQEDTALLRTLHTALNLSEQGYDDKVRRLLSKHAIEFQTTEQLEESMTKVKARVEKAKAALARKPEKEKEKDVVEEPEVKRRREDMGEDERRTFDAWVQEVKKKREDLLERRAARHTRKQQLAKRRTAASQERMRIISQLAKHSKKEDDFGRNDDDWEVYKKINKDVGDSDSEEELVRLSEYETVLKEHDPTFSLPEDDEVSHDSVEWYQLHLATERIRVPEVLFQPSLVGHDQAGISETLEFILKKYPDDVQNQLINNVFLTGSLANFPGFKERLEKDIMAVRPFQSTFKVSVAQNPTLDAWHGARDLAKSARDSESCFLSRIEYEEQGSSASSFFREHACSNKYFATPEVLPEAD